MAGGKVIKRGKTRIVRATLRRSIGALQDQLISQIARTRYEKAILRYFEWLEGEEMGLPGDEKLLDENLCVYIEDVWQSGEVKALVSNLLSGLGSLCKNLKGKYKTAWALYTAWGQLEMPQRARPFSEIDILAIAGRLIKAGQYELGILVLIGFHCILRTSEMLSLRVASCEFSRCGKCCLLKLGFTKGGKRKGKEESVTVTDKFLVKALHLLCEGKDAGDLLVDCSYQVFRRVLGDVLLYLGMDKQGYRSYSIRRGGATYNFRVTGSYDRTCERGRWGNVKTCRMYIDEAANLSSVTLSNRSKARFNSCLSVAQGIV